VGTWEPGGFSLLPKALAMGDVLEEIFLFFFF
jgi:hypothetical protein